MTLAACYTGLLVVALLLAASLAQAQDIEQVDAGRLLFHDRCQACHSLLPGQSSKGPSLRGIFGAAAGQRPGFAYSDALKYSGKVWNTAQLDAFLRNPAGVVPGTKMKAGAIADSEKRHAVIAYLQTLR